MKQKLCLTAAALLLTAAVNLHPCCRVEVAGQPLEGLYAAGAIRRGQEAARCAAEELLPGEASLPELRLRQCLSLRPPEGRAETLSDALLRATPGVTVLAQVSVEGHALGLAGDAELLAERLRARLYEGSPPGTLRAWYEAEPEISLVYAREGSQQEIYRLLAPVYAEARPVYLSAGGERIKG